MNWSHFFFLNPLMSCASFRIERESSCLNCFLHGERFRWERRYSHNTEACAQQCVCKCVEKKKQQKTKEVLPFSFDHLPAVCDVWENIRSIWRWARSGWRGGKWRQGERGKRLTMNIPIGKQKSVCWKYWMDEGWTNRRVVVCLKK